MRIIPPMLAVSLALALPTPATAQGSAAIAAPALSPGEIVAAAPASDWVAIAPDDLLVMTLAPGRDPGSAAGAAAKPREIIIQLMPPPFSQDWVGNIRKFAAARWWDGLSINRVQDNYVVQWGDPDGEDKAKAKPLPGGLATPSAGSYVAEVAGTDGWLPLDRFSAGGDTYAAGGAGFRAGWPLAAGQQLDGEENLEWPVHCYGMVGVGRNYSPDTGSGAELYAVIGHAPRHLDRNIALVGRVVEGIEHLSSLPRGTAALGFFDKPEQRIAIQSIRLASALPKARQPRFEYLSTQSGSFARYASARANRRDPFFITPAGAADICNIPVPVRRKAAR